MLKYEGMWRGKKGLCETNTNVICLIFAFTVGKLLKCHPRSLPVPLTLCEIMVAVLLPHLYSPLAVKEQLRR